jgi:hypothetical protein
MVDELRARHDSQVVVLIPVLVPDRLRYRLLHNQVDLILAAELRKRSDIVVARVPMVLHQANGPPQRERAGDEPAPDPTSG